ncbi:hypothetical protein BH10PLA2_BH10PLA2_04260 [soil metagenome]
MSSPATNDAHSKLPVACHPIRTFRVTIVAAVLLFAGYLVLNAWFLSQLGIRVSGDGALYVSGADDLSHGRPVQELLRSRFGYICLVALCQETGLLLAGVVTIQILIGGIAAIALYHLGSQLAGPWAGIGAAAIFALNPDFVHWHCYILTDSLYISSVILATWAIHWAVQGDKGRHWHRYLLAATILSVAPLIRPNGWLLVLIAACYWFAKLTPRLLIRVTGIVLAGIAFVIGFFLLLSAKPGLLTNSPETMLRRGEVIWGYPAARISMPPDEALESGLPGASGYVLRHPLASARLAVIRVLTELVHARPYYSPRHNAVCLLVVLPVYLFGLYGFCIFWKDDLARLIAFIIVTHLTIQAVNYADWSGRFLLYVFPLMGVLAAVGIVHVLAKSRLPSITRR